MSNWLTRIQTVRFFAAAYLETSLRYFGWYQSDSSTKMFFTVFVSVLVTLWILFCVGVYVYYYVIEVVLDLPIPGQSPSTAHAALKQVIERLLRESGVLPHLTKAQDQPAIPPEESGRTYEDLLATAIINKVVTNSQKNLPSSSRGSVSSRVSNSSRNLDKEYFFGEETLDSKWKTTDLETSSISSLEDWIHSDSSFGSKKYVDRRTLTIKQDIEEILQSDSEDDAEYFRSKSALLTDDEPNWILQKRQFQGTNSPVPVPMLIPNPTTEAKVLIGDKEIDDTSDLSDIAFDFEEPELLPTKHSLLVESRTVIGGKNLLLNTGSESESSADSGVKEVDAIDKSSYDALDGVLENESKADKSVDDDNVDDASITSVYSNTEQEAEYTERYASLPRTMVKSPTPAKRTSIHNAIIMNNKNKGAENETRHDDAIDIHNDKDLEEFTGSYSRREKEKWKNAIHLDYNPYSKENIERRIQRSSSSVSSLFGPDYYARQASSPAGSKKATEIAGISWPPPERKEEEVQEVQIVLSDESLLPSPTNNNSVEIDQDDVFQTPEAPKIIHLKMATPFVRPEGSYSDTSDTDLSGINYYDVENSKVFKKTKNNVGPEPNESSNASLSLDENSNSTEERNKHKFVKNDSQTSNKERPKYLKLTSLSRPAKQNHTPEGMIRRHKSESDLLEDLDLRPTVIGRKKDNTLISKIYSNPHVRQFALSSRNELPYQEDAIQNGHSEKHSATRSYNSDDGLSRSLVSAYSSNEDLLNSRHNTPSVSAKNPRTRQTQYSFSSEDDIFSDTASHKSTKLSINGSIENLLASTPNGLHFSSPKSPESMQDSPKTFDSVDSPIGRHQKRAEHPKPLLLSRPVLVGERTPSPDIEELVKKKLVHNILDQFEKSGSYPSTPLGEAPKKESSKHGGDATHISVRDLRKMFENNDTTSRVVSSLTARSLSKQMREELKN